MCSQVIKTATFLFMVFFITRASAQDVDRKKADILYINLPLKALPKEVETYHVNLKPKTTSWGNTFGNVYEAEKIKLYGYYRLADASDANLLIESEVVNDLIFDEVSEQKSEYKYRKDKNSPEITYVAYTYYVTYYTPKFRYSLRTRKGEVIKEGYVGGEQNSMHYGNTNYDNHYSNSYSLAAAWRNDKSSLMAGREREGFASALTNLQGNCLSQCMYIRKVDFSVRFVDEKKGKMVYADLREAKDHYLESIALIANDKISMINKLVQPDYVVRKEIMMKAISLWEKALAEADYDNKKARIDGRVARHLYYNLALGYVWIDDFVKAKEYAQGRKKDVGSWDKNFLAGIQSLSSTIDDRAARHEANKWRPLLLEDSNVYVYKNPATRLKEQEEAIARMKVEKADSSARVVAEKKKASGGKTAAKTIAKKPSAAGVVVKAKTPQTKVVTKNE